MQPSELKRIIEALDGMSLSQLQRFVREAETRRRQGRGLDRNRTVHRRPKIARRTTVTRHSAQDATAEPWCGDAAEAGYSGGAAARAATRSRRSEGRPDLHAAHDTGLAHTRKRGVLLAFTKKMLMLSPMSCQGPTGTCRPTEELMNTVAEEWIERDKAEREAEEVTPPTARRAHRRKDGHLRRLRRSCRCFRVGPDRRARNRRSYRTDARCG